MLEMNPTYTEARGNVSAEDMMFAIENNGNTFDFDLTKENKTDNDKSIYSYKDGTQGFRRNIPRWAIS